jgi:hypothetical protein
MTDAELAETLVHAAFTITEGEWAGVCRACKDMLGGVDLTEDYDAKAQFFLAVLASGEGQWPPAAVRTMVRDCVRKMDPQLGRELHGELAIYERIVDDWTSVKSVSTLPVPPLEFELEALGIAFIDSTCLIYEPKIRAFGTYNIATIMMLGATIARAGAEVRRLWRDAGSTSVS